MRLTDHYDRKYAGQSGPAEIARVAHAGDRFEALVEVAARGAHGRYLEIGAGSGATLRALEPLYDELVGTELSPVRGQQLAAAFAGHGKVRVVCHDIEAERLRFPDDYFDTIAMSAVIEHLVEPIAALVELRRVLRPGGRLLIDTPNIAKWTRRVKLALGYFPATASHDEGLTTYDRKPSDLHDEGHLHYFTFRSLRRICTERAGFSAVLPHGYGRTALSRWWPTLFSDDVFVVAIK